MIRALVLALALQMPSGVQIHVHADRGWVLLATNGACFLVRATSERLDHWADSIAALRTRGERARLAYFDSTLGAMQAMTFVRRGDDSASGYEIIGEDGDATGSTYVSFDSARTLVAKLRSTEPYPTMPVVDGIPRDAPPFYDFQVERMAIPRSLHPPSPRYPPTFRDNHEDGQVLAQFVIDATGRADITTFRALKTTDAQFTEAVRRAVQRTLYFPAEIAGRYVAELVQEPFGFHSN